MDEKPRQRWFRFSMRTLLVVVTSFAIWFGVQTNRARNQERAVEWLTQLQQVKKPIQIVYDWQYVKPTQSIASMGPPGPEWLRKIIGDEYFQRIAGLDFQSTAIEDSDLTWLESLPDLRLVSLGSTLVTDDGMQHLAGLRNLETLAIGGTQVGDAGLEHLRHLTKLRELSCGGTRITDNGLATLPRFQELETLFIGGTKITDAGLEHLERLQNLTFLDIDGTGISEEGVARLKASLPNCRIRIEGRMPVRLLMSWSHFGQHTVRTLPAIRAAGEHQDGL